MLRHKHTGVLFFQAGSVSSRRYRRIVVSGGWVFRRETGPTYPQAAPATHRWLDHLIAHRRIAHGLILMSNAKLHREIDSNHGGKKHQAKFITLYFLQHQQKTRSSCFQIGGLFGGMKSKRL